MRGVLVLTGLLLSCPAFAYESVPVMSFAKPTANGKYVLVMLHPFDGAGGKGLREKYGGSGLFAAGGPKKMVWACDWKADREYNVFVSDDGVFALRVPDGEPGLRHWHLMNDKPVPARAAGWEDAPALFIYKDGKPFKTLALRDVFDCSRFTDRDYYMGPVIVVDSFLDELGRVSVSSEAGGRKQTATVAFRTGAVLEPGRAEAGAPGAPTTGGGRGEPNSGRGRVRGFLIGLGVSGCLAAFVGVAVLLIRHKRPRKG
jgi:hypothetical protein